MTLANDQLYVGYTAAPGQTQFAYGWKIFDDPLTELLVFVNRVFLAPANYSVTGVGLPAGGLLIMNTPMVGGEEVFILADMDASQEVGYTPGGAFPAASHELGLDRLARLIQLSEIQDIQSLQLGISAFLSVPPINTVLPDPTEGALVFIPGTPPTVAGKFDWVPLDMIGGGTGGGVLPDQTGQSGNLLTTNGVVAAWANILSFLPALVPGSLLSNSGGALAWVPPPVGLPAVVNDRRLISSPAGVVSWAPHELPVNPVPLVPSLLRLDQFGNRTWIDEAAYRSSFLVSSSFTSGADDTINLQAAVDAAVGNMLLIDANYSVRTINVPSNTILFFLPSVQIDAEPDQPANSGVFSFQDVVDVTIHGNGASIEGGNLQPTVNDRHGLDIAGSIRVTVNDLLINGASGDGVHVRGSQTGGLPVSNCVLTNVTSQNSNGSGLRIVSSSGTVVESGNFIANGRAAAGAVGNAGIALIPETTNDLLLAIVISDVRTSSNGIGSGVAVDLRPWNNHLNAEAQITVQRHVSREFDKVGFRYQGMIANEAFGFVRYLDCAVRAPLDQGVSIEGADKEGPITEILRVNIDRVNTAGNLLPHERTGIFVGALVGGGGATSVGNVVIEGAMICDQVNPSNADSFILVQNFVTPSDIERVHILNLRDLAWRGDPTKLDRNRLIFAGGADCLVTDPSGVLRYTAAADETVSTANGYAIFSNEGVVGRRIYTLDSAFVVDSPDLRFEVQDNQPLRILAPPLGRIHSGGGLGQWIESRKAGSQLVLRPSAGGVFEIVEQTGQWGFETEASEVTALVASGAAGVTSLYQRSFAANALEIGDEVHMICSGTIEEGTGNKEFGFSLNGNQILADISNGGNVESWEVEAHVLIVGTTQAVVRVLTYARTDRQRHEVAVESVNLAGTITLEMTVDRVDPASVVTRRTATTRIEHHPVP